MRALGLGLLIGCGILWGLAALELSGGSMRMHPWGGRILLLGMLAAVGAVIGLVMVLASLPLFGGA